MYFIIFFLCDIVFNTWILNTHIRESWVYTKIKQNQLDLSSIKSTQKQRNHEKKANKSDLKKVIVLQSFNFFPTGPFFTLKYRQKNLNREHFHDIKVVIFNWKINCVKKRLPVSCALPHWHYQMSVEFIHFVTLPDSIGFLYNAFAWAFSPIIYLLAMNGHFSCLMHLIMKFKTTTAEHPFKCKHSR